MVLVLALLAVLLLSQYLLSALVRDVPRYVGPLGVAVALFPTISAALCALALARARGLSATALGFARVSSWKAPYLAWMGAVAAGPAFSGVVAVFGLQTWEPFRLSGLLRDSLLSSWQMVAWYALGVVVIAPVVEEVVFRGMLYRAVRQRWLTPPALLASGLVFAGAHFEPTTLLPLVFVGMLFAWAYERSGSIWGSIVPHAGLNLLTLIAVLARVR